MKNIHALTLLLFIASYHLHANNNYRNCIILLNSDDTESVGSAKWFLMGRLQSAIAEKSTPLLVSASLWNSFIERKIHFQQNLPYTKTAAYKICNIYTSINERMKYWSNHYNTLSNDISQNKKLVIQQINKEFYHNKKDVSGLDYQFLLTLYTDFDPQEWDIYTNNSGFYLLVPKSYSNNHAPLGFKTDSLQKVTDPEDTSSIYFASRTQKQFSDSLPDFFMTYADFNNQEIPYLWNIVLAGHGGSHYTEKNQNETITWSGEPIIADLTVEEFKNVLEFFHSCVKTHAFHYGCCYGGGNHTSLIFNNACNTGYNFGIICDCLTDCMTYCKWSTLLPSDEKKFLTSDDIVYDEIKQCWQLPLTPVYNWEKFFNEISSVNSIGAIEHFHEITKSIAYSAIANTQLLCLPNTQTFFPLQAADVIKIDDTLLEFTKTDDESIILNDIKTILVESSIIIPTINLHYKDPLRIVSIKPDNALHYIRKLEADNYLDLPSVFWQAEYQRYDKTFIINECVFPDVYDFQNIASQTKQLTLKNVIISQQKYQYMRIFFTIDDTAIIIIANKKNEEQVHARVKEVVTMTPAARDKYEEYYASLKNSCFK